MSAVIYDISQIEATIARWLELARLFREAAAEREQGDDEEEVLLCTTEASRLERCAVEILEALHEKKAS